MADNPQESTDISNPMIGQVLDGRYRIVKPLGAGGMGAVFLGQHLSINKPVAIKILHPQLMLDQTVVQRFKQEIAAMSAISHPHLISIYDAGTTPQQTPYFVMEYVDGNTLSEVLAIEKTLDLKTAVRVFEQIASA